MTISLAVLATVIAIVGIWGYSNIKDEARRAAKEAAQTKQGQDSEQPSQSVGEEYPGEGIS